MQNNKPKKLLRIGIKIALTILAFYFLLSHEIKGDDGAQISVLNAIITHLADIDASVFIPFILCATLIKCVGIFSSMIRWHILLIGQGIRFNFGHIVGSFLIGRFLGTFLPSTLGLDGYKLYDASRFSKDMVRPAAATVIEKVMGLSGIFLTFLVTLPFGYTILGENAALTIALTVPIASGIVGGLFLLLFKPTLVQKCIQIIPSFGRKKVETFINKASKAAAAYKNQSRLLIKVAVLSFLVHFCTAAMYYFTALAVGAQNAFFWQISFASSIQIFATVMSPFTIAGEGIREIVQALLLAKHIGTSESILSAALGFWAAEAVTLIGAFFLWKRGADYAPKELIATPSEHAV